MKVKSFLFLVLVLTTTLLTSQETPFYKTYSLENNPKYSVEESEEPLIAIKDKNVTEFYFENKDLIEYFLVHKVLWLNSDDAIEDFNKIYLPISQSSELKASKARVINPDGKIITLDDSKILTSKDEETGRTYKYMALEGVTKGSFIEYMYVIKKSPSFTGKRVFIQDDFYKKEVEFDLYAPKNLMFKFKSYNDTPLVKQDTIIKEKLHWQLKVTNVNKLEDEYQAPYHASRKFVVYKLEKNLATNVTNIISYDKVSRNLYNYYYADYDKSTLALIKKFIKETKLSEDLTEEETIRKLDDYIKNNIYTEKYYAESLEDLTTVLKKKVANDAGILKLYIATLKALNIKHELVITSDRKKIKFDPEFEANNFLDEFLIYFPNSKKYLSPNASGTRFGFPRAYNLDNYGLFIKEVKIGSNVSAVGRIKYLKPVKVEETKDIMNVIIDFDKEDITKNKLHFDRSMSGYYAMSIQPFMHLIKGEKREDLIKSFFENIAKDLEFINKEVKNDKPGTFGVKPLQFIADFTTESFVEKAGKKYLFKLGDVIGPQIELYQEKERVLPLEERFHRSYYRTLTVNIPEGYSVTNLDDINIDNSFYKEDKELFSFKSFYKLEGNKLVITADEHYKENIVPVSLFEQFRTVINSAADFNKIVLVLEKIE